VRLPDIRRLAAIDLHGAHGTRARRRVILAEFGFGAVGGTGLGVFVAAAGLGVGWTIFGVWLAGTCLNYVPLALQAVSLSRPGRLAAELGGADVRSELRRYTKAQFWIVVPLLFCVLAIVQRRG
jgi:uncharacterized membrane protein